MRTKTSQLPRLCCHLFGWLESLWVVGAVILCVLILALPRISNHAELALGEVGLVPESGALTVQADDSKAETISINNLQGTVSVRNPGNGNGLFAMTRWYILPVVIAYVGFIAVLFDLLRRLFRNVDRGESFTERSVHLVHKIGMTIFVFTLLSSAVRAWHSHTITAYLERHATVRGINMAFTPPRADSVLAFRFGDFEFHFPWGEF